MAKSATGWTARITRVFSDEENRAYGEEYTRLLHEQLREVHKSAGHAVSFMLILIAIFELFVRAGVSKLSVGPVEVKDLTLVRKVLPVVVAYYFYDYCHQYSLALQLDRAYSAIIRVLHKDIAREHLEDLVIPVRPSITAAVTSPYPTADTTGTRAFLELTYGILALFILAIPFIGGIAFEVYAYYHQFRTFSSHDIAVWVTLLMTAGLMIYGLLGMGFIPREDEDEPGE